MSAALLLSFLQGRLILQESKRQAEQMLQPNQDLAFHQSARFLNQSGTDIQYAVPVYHFCALSQCAVAKRCLSALPQCAVSVRCVVVLAPIIHRPSLASFSWVDILTMRMHKGSGGLADKPLVS
eukprot:1160472-Pelagomonas_calceolata.AAC.1